MAWLASGRPVLLSLLFLFAGISVQADGIRILGSAQESARARIDLIRDAKEEILLSTYIFRDDWVGMHYLSELRAAALRGVRVTLIVDGHGTELPAALISELRKSGIKFLTYHPFDWKHPLDALRRMHDKLLVVDGQHLVMGDRNHTGEYYDLADKTRVSKDVYLRGKSAQDAGDYFRQLAASDEVKEVPLGKYSEKDASHFASRLDRYRKSYALTAALKDLEGWRNQVREVSGATFFHDPIGEKGFKPGVEAEVLSAIRNARSKIVIENPYIALTDEFKSALRSAAERGVRIEVLTNSIYSTDLASMGAAWERSRLFFAEIGADVWEVPGAPGTPEGAPGHEKVRRSPQRLRHLFNKRAQNQGMLHSKTILVDDEIAYFMSYNLDPRSQKLNMEVLERVPDKNIAQELNGILEEEKKTIGYIRTLEGGRFLVAKRSCNLYFRILSWVLEPQL